MSDKSNEIIVRQTVVGNGRPIVNSGYDCLRLLIEHEAVLPDGTSARLPAGTLLYMRTPGVGEGFEQDRGIARVVDEVPGSGGET